MSKEAFVLPRASLEEARFIPSNTEKRAFYTKIENIGELYRFLKLSKKTGAYRERGGVDDIEKNPSLQQLIMYGFVEKNDGRFLIYQRGGVENYDETRLAGKVSLGIGGHMERTDISLGQSFYRELNEEAQVFIGCIPLNFYNRDGQLDLRLMKKYVRVTPLGFIKDDRDSVGQVHFGVVCRITPKNEYIEVRICENGENISYQYVNREVYSNLLSMGEITPEGWSEIVFNEEINLDNLGGDARI